MRHSLPIAPQFYVTAAQPCPYLPDRQERKLFTSLGGDNAPGLNDALSTQGFRRSQNVLYRPACTECAACMSARIDLQRFTPSRTQKRISKRNAGLQRRISAPWANEEQFDLFRRYLDARHLDGGMADMDVFEFAAMIEETPVQTRVIEYIDPQTDELRAACLTDILEDGLSLVYSFYDPDLRQSSLGQYIILDHIELARASNLPYVYLGYWVPGSQKMDYKSKFKGLEVCRNNSWQALDVNADYSNSLHPIQTPAISEQVASIVLPVSRMPAAGS